MNQDQMNQASPNMQNSSKNLAFFHSKYFWIGLSLSFFLLISVFFLSEQKNNSENLGGQMITQTPQSTLAPAPKAPRVEDQLIIQYKAGIPDSTINENLKRYNATVIKRIQAIHRLVIKVPSGTGDQVLQQLAADNLIENAEPDYINKVLFTPNDTNFGQQWGLVNTGQSIAGSAGTPNADVDADLAWDVTRGNGIVIAILDTGIDDTHPDLAGKILAQKDFYSNGKARDSFGHGTHTAGIAAASSNNGSGISGTCPDCKLIVAKVLDDSGSGPDSVIDEGIIWAADNGAKVINMSLGGPNNSSSKQDAINYAWSKGAVIVASAGNDGDTQKNYPGGNNNVVSVASTTNKDTKSSFSTYGSWVKVAAPGSNIYSTLPTFPYALQSEKPGLKTNYDFLSGTSMAAPMTAGVVGLIWGSQYGTSAQAVVDRLYNNADKIAGTGQYWIHGRINAAKAVGTALATPTPTPTQIVSNTPGIPSPTSPFATPTLYCLGACPTIAVSPTSGLPNSKEPTTTTYPSSSIPSTPTSSQQPIVTQAPGISTSPIKPGKIGRGGFWQFLQQLIQWIMQLLQQLFGGIISRPIAAQPTVIPTQAKAPDSGSTPTSSLQPTTQSTVSPTSIEVSPTNTTERITDDPYQALRTSCVNKINSYRATIGAPALAQWQGVEDCIDGQAKADALSGKPHGQFGKCGEYSQNESEAGGTLEQALEFGLQGMWDEGPSGGHYKNMADRGVTKVACGFYVYTNSGFPASFTVQDFR